MSTIMTWGIIVVLILSAFAYYFIRGALMPKKDEPEYTEFDRTRRDIICCTAVVTGIACIILGLATAVVWNNFNFYQFEEKKLEALILSRQIKGVAEIAVASESEALQHKTSSYIRNLHSRDALDKLGDELYVPP